MAHNNSKDLIIARDAVVGATCVLSILGAGAIILSFLLLREVRTSVRFLLFNLSIADLLVAVSNLVGISVFYRYSVPNEVTIDNTTCQMTGSMGLFATNSSILWTMAVVTYLYISMACCRPSKRVNRVAIVLVTIFCWALPAIVAILLAILGLFSLSDTGFCTLTKHHMYVPIASYDIFLIPAFVILPLLSVGFVLHMSFKVGRMITCFIHSN